MANDESSGANSDELTHVPAEKTAAVATALVGFEIDPNYKKWPVLDPSVRYKRGQLDVRQELRVDMDLDLPDYSGPFKSDLRFTDFSREQLVRMLTMCDEYRQVWVGAWLDEVENYFGRRERLDIESRPCSTSSCLSPSLSRVSPQLDLSDSSANRPWVMQISASITPCPSLLNRNSSSCPKSSWS